ncbi:hypothetical protein OUZ56_000732 [Daphnia magna]|uniref:GMP synthase n=1 Tax=Daphnia magna TaxID=35525 RepID=A0ABR0A0M0_9CRUS|nr:hypothetical protein OUZ56_000732 [Daphnia magna]
MGNKTEDVHKVSQADTHPKSHGVREQCVESDIIALETPAALLLQQGYKAIKISGGPNSVYDGGCPTIRPINLYLRSSNAGNLLWPAQQGISTLPK